MEAKIKTGSKKGTLILIHGNSSSWKVYKDFLEEDSIDLTKIAICLDGHVDAEAVNGSDGLLSLYSNQLLSFINDIDDEILLVGNSLGGHLTIEIANEISRLKGLVIFGTPPIKKPVNIEEAFLPVFELQTYLTENPTQTEIENASKVGVYDKKNATKIESDFLATDSKVRKLLLEDLSGNKWNDQRQLFINFDLPRFIIHGKQDPSVNLEYLKKIQKECAGNCELITIDECGHYASLEQPKKFAEIIASICLKIF